jgi:hypothetical protein
MGNLAETGSIKEPRGQAPPAEQAAMNEDQWEQKREQDYLRKSRDCGAAAYISLTDKYSQNQALQNKMAEICKKWGSALKDSGKNRHMPFGEKNYQAKKHIESPQNYIQEFETYLKELQKEAEVAPSVTPEDTRAIKKQAYSHDAQGNPRFPNEKNWTQIISTDFKESYLELIERVRRTLEGFGEAAKDAGDGKIYSLVQKALEESK